MSDLTHAGEVDLYERELAAWFRVPQAVGVSTGSAALHLALTALGIGHGDEVLVPALAPPSSIMPVIRAGARPVFVDCGPTGAGLDLADVADKITAKSRAMMLVHLWGRTGDAHGAVEIAGDHGLRVIEDATHAVGTIIDDTPAGTLGDAGCVSTRQGNLLDSGTGGFLLIHDPALAQKCRALRERGHALANADTPSAAVGYEYRLAGSLAAVARAHLTRLPEKLRNHAWRTARLTEHLHECPELALSPATGPESWNGHSALAYLKMLRPRSFSVHLDRHGITNSVGSHSLVSADQLPIFEPYVDLPCLRARVVFDTTLAISPPPVSDERLREIAATVARAACDWPPA
ncbi:dTDP-4-amino-4,6-dideoxygalactose transaminase [Crossiella equi]|uniref:dTDP-4-amino-4,6-dideoxygalactose transaminase n=1 Tax=Crossiella equi TaxID=130796 RepID=A0ABS5AM29_9PSEU|nr:DegT/DnrJ/EryC1/StrS family aminotransferase [Crossiella equi]MBP2477623.1 dTDP-4-amino-4,6-dideoxygalactose transaminase [Crossiella equi]